MSTTAIPQIDWTNLEQARKFYAAKYEYLHVPWVVSEEADAVTRPDGVQGLQTPWGNLVGSAEQSFIQLMLDGKMRPGRFMTITPCFRREKEFDALHYPYFMKLELLDLRDCVASTNYAVDAMMNDARLFFATCGVETWPEEQWDHSLDLKTEDGVEVGSYGWRHLDKGGGWLWVYGTGCAEPRLSSLRKAK